MSHNSLRASSSRLVRSKQNGQSNPDLICKWDTGVLKQLVSHQGAGIYQAAEKWTNTKERFFLKRSAIEVAELSKRLHV